MQYVTSPDQGPLRQGELLADIVEHKVVSSATAIDRIEAHSIEHSLSVILNSDCDLEWDHRARQEDEGPDSPKIVPYAMLYDLFQLTEVRESLRKSSAFKRVKQKQDERYHLLEEATVKSKPIPQLFIDFKRLYAIPMEGLYLAIEAGEVTRQGIVPPIYVHDLIQRCYAYHSRIGIPAT